MIVQELSSLGGGLRSPSALVFYLFIFFGGGGGDCFCGSVVVTDSISEF